MCSPTRKKHINGGNQKKAPAPNKAKSSLWRSKQATGTGHGNTKKKAGTVKKKVVVKGTPTSAPRKKANAQWPAPPFQDHRNKSCVKKRILGTKFAAVVVDCVRTTHSPQ